MAKVIKGDLYQDSFEKILALLIEKIIYKYEVVLSPNQPFQKWKQKNHFRIIILRTNLMLKVPIVHAH